jgi:hypothetical protein
VAEEVTPHEAGEKLALAAQEIAELIEDLRVRVERLEQSDKQTNVMLGNLEDEIDTFKEAV